jgi:hypothetical protein
MEGVLERRFNEIGARVKFTNLSRRDLQSDLKIVVDVKRDKNGEFFEVASDSFENIVIPNVVPKDRHLLLIHKDDSKRIINKVKFLCGHDETHWFAASIPETVRNVVDVNSAKQALKPTEVVLVESSKGLTKSKPKAHLHRNSARVRQGEWFFIPIERNFNQMEILKNEPIRRGRGKPHVCEELVRFGGNTVMVNSRFPNGITVGEYDNLIKSDPKMAKFPWRRMTRDMKVFVRGKIRHPDHKTISLRIWHEVIPNEETKARSNRNLAFLD